MAVRIKINAPKNLPLTISQRLRGLVKSISNVPCFFSSEKLFMVTAGIRKISIQGANLKNGLISAYPEFKMLKSPSKTHKNNPFINRKTRITIYPINELKNELISFFNKTTVSTKKKIG